MKSLIMVTLLMGYSLVSCSQDISARDVPSVVSNAFDAAYPDARDIEWEKEGDQFEVEFEVKDVDQVALLDNSGNLVMYKKDIRVSELPAAVTDAIKQNYDNKQIDDADLVEKDGTTYYQVELEGGIRDEEIVFSEDGQVVNDFKYWD